MYRAFRALLFLIGFAILLDLFFSVSTFFAFTTASSVQKEELIHITRQKIPIHLRGVFVSAHAGRSELFREKILAWADAEHINTIVLDIKDNDGLVLWNGKIESIKKFISQLHNKNIYVIGRVAVFQDPLYVSTNPSVALQTQDGSIWKNNKGISWIDPADTTYWKYVTNLGEVAYAYGFDEIQFDYVRYPTDGNVRDIAYARTATGSSTKYEVINSFFKHVHDHFSVKHIPISADIFGIIFTHPHEKHTLGQSAESAFKYFDHVSPMIYPSHFYSGTLGYTNPSEHPYEIIQYALTEAITRAMEAEKADNVPAGSYQKKIRPWYQDFNYGSMYDNAEALAQIKAGQELNIQSYLFWNAGVSYSAEVVGK